MATVGWIRDNGSDIVGTYYYNVAMSKVKRVEPLAKEAGYPLRFTIEQTSPESLPF